MTQRTPEIVQSFLGQRILEDLTFALQDLSDITETGWNPLQESNLLVDITRYFSEWRPSYDQIIMEEHTNLLAKESSTMFAIIEMRKSAAVFLAMAQQQQLSSVQYPQQQLML